jgi:hypothetical protein
MRYSDSSNEWHKPATIEIPIDRRCIGPCTSFVRAYAERQEIPVDKIDSICRTLQKILKRLIESNSLQTFKDNIVISLKRTDHQLEIDIVNRGYPFFAGAQWVNSAIDRQTQEGMALIRQVFNHVEYKNNGRSGQQLSLAIEITPETSASEVLKSHSVDEKVSYGVLQPGKETELSRLFCSVYGYNYIRDDVYYPERLHALNISGELISRVAITEDGRLAAHVGMVKLNENPAVYEIALGLSDPRVKVKGMFSQLFDQIIKIVEQTPMEYCIFDFVTNHDYSQKIVSRYGSKEMAISIGCQISETQAKLETLGIGTDPKGSDRFSLLIGIRPSKEHPFGKDVTLPVHIGEMFEFLLTNLGMSWNPAPRFFPLAQHGSFTKVLQPSQKAAYFDLVHPGFQATKTIVREWRHLLRLDYKYAAIDIPLDAPGLGQVFDYLVKQGFFVAGFVPYHNSNQIAFRLQSIGAIRINFHEIMIASETGKTLLEVIRKGYERSLSL